MVLVIQLITTIFEEADVPADSKNNTFIAGELQLICHVGRCSFLCSLGKRLRQATRVDIVFKTAH